MRYIVTSQQYPSHATSNIVSVLPKSVGRCLFCSKNVMLYSWDGKTHRNCIKCYINHWKTLGWVKYRKLSPTENLVEAMRVFEVVSEL